MFPYKRTQNIVITILLLAVVNPRLILNGIVHPPYGCFIKAMKTTTTLILQRSINKTEQIAQRHEYKRRKCECIKDGETALTNNKINLNQLINIGHVT